MAEVNRTEPLTAAEVKELSRLAAKLEAHALTLTGNPAGNRPVKTTEEAVYAAACQLSELAQTLPALTGSGGPAYTADELDHCRPRPGEFLYETYFPTYNGGYTMRWHEADRGHYIMVTPWHER